MQRMALIGRKAIDDLVHVGIANIDHIHHKGDSLARKRMIGIYRQFAISYMTDTKGFALPSRILQLNFRSYAAELWGHILDIIGKRQIGIVWTEAFGGIKRNFNPISNFVAFQCHLDFLEQGAVTAVNIAYRHVRLFKHRSRLVDDRICNVNSLVPGNFFIRHGASSLIDFERVGL